MLTAPGGTGLNRLSADSVFWTVGAADYYVRPWETRLNRLSADSVFWTLGGMTAMLSDYTTSQPPFG